MTDKILLNGEYEWLGLWKKTFTNKDGKEISSLSWTIEINDNIPNGKYYVNIYKNDEKKSENSPDYIMYFKPVVEQTKIENTDDDF